jgi:hypothetical protein
MAGQAASGAQPQNAQQAVQQANQLLGEASAAQAQAAQGNAAAAQQAANAAAQASQALAQALAQQAGQQPGQGQGQGQAQAQGQSDQAQQPSPTPGQSADPKSGIAAQADGGPTDLPPEVKAVGFPPSAWAKLAPQEQADLVNAFKDSGAKEHQERIKNYYIRMGNAPRSQSR